MKEHNGKVVAITGAANGIGRALAISYGEQGAILVLFDKNAEGLQQTQELLPKRIKATSFVLDLANPAHVVDDFQAINLNFGRLDVLINNAGFGITKSPYELGIEEWDSVLNTNLRGTFLCSREAAKIMKEKEGGSIVNIASTRALMSEPNSEAYAASKGGILALTHAMAISLGQDKIRVNAITPGWIETGEYTKLRKIDHEQHPSGRVGKSEDIVRACLYLTHPNNDFVTGTNLIVDGGMTRKMIYEE